MSGIASACRLAAASGACNGAIVEMLDVVEAADGRTRSSLNDRAQLLELVVSPILDHQDNRFLERKGRDLHRHEFGVRGWPADDEQVDDLFKIMSSGQSSLHPGCGRAQSMAEECRSRGCERSNDQRR